VRAIVNMTALVVADAGAASPSPRAT